MTGDLHLSLLFPEALCLALLLAVFFLNLFLPGEAKSRLGSFTLAGLGVLFGACLLASRSPGEALYGMYTQDAFAAVFKALFVLITAAVVVMAEGHRLMFKEPGEFYVLVLAALLGMLFLASTQDLLLLFISIELMTISFYLLTAYLRTDARSVEAGVKYLILGSLSTAFMLYGISFLYGNASSTHLDALQLTAARATSLAPSLVLGAFLVMAGLSFKVGSVPFHFWIPDVYEGAPLPVTAFLAAGSKVAAFAVILKILAALAPLQQTWTLVFAFLAAATLFYGNLGAIPQTNIKRFLGYSSIGHAGFMLMGVAAGGLSGGSAIAFYLIAYGVTTVAAFLVVVFACSVLASEDMEAFDGLSERSPLLAAALFIALLSLAGVPPLAGFFAKFLILSAAVEKGLIWLALLGAANVVISLYYYLVLVKRLYIHKPRTAATTLPVVPVSLRISLYASMAAMVVMGVVQGPFVDLASRAVQALF